MTVERCLILDTETSSLREDAPALEVGAVLYSVRNRTTLAQVSCLFPGGINEAEHVNGISQAALDEMLSLHSINARSFLLSLAENADVIVAHNATFDRAHLPIDPWHRFRWLCTMEDFIWPKGIAAGKVALLALDHGIPVVDTHRAWPDCHLIAKLFTAMGDELPRMIEQAMRPKSLYEAVDECNFWSLTSEQQEARKRILSENGFRWNRLVSKRWSRVMADEDAALLPFGTRRVSEA